MAGITTYNVMKKDEIINRCRDLEVENLTIKEERKGLLIQIREEKGRKERPRKRGERKGEFTKEELATIEATFRKTAKTRIYQMSGAIKELEKELPRDMIKTMKEEMKEEWGLMKRIERKAKKKLEREEKRK